MVRSWYGRGTVVVRSWCWDCFFQSLGWRFSHRHWTLCRALIPDICRLVCQGGRFYRLDPPPQHLFCNARKHDHKNACARISIDIHGGPWMSMDMHGFSMDVLGHMDIHGYSKTFNVSRYREYMCTFTSLHQWRVQDFQQPLPTQADRKLGLGPGPALGPRPQVVMEPCRTQGFSSARRRLT